MIYEKMKAYMMPLISAALFFAGFGLALYNTPIGKDWVGVLTALITLTIALFAVGIAVIQAQTNHKRLKHERFDRRFIVYDATYEFIRSIASAGAVPERAIEKFVKGTHGAQFVFDEDLSEYLSKVLRKATSIDTWSDLADSTQTSSERHNISQTLQELRAWFGKQVDGELDKQFDRFLRL